MTDKYDSPLFDFDEAHQEVLPDAEARFAAVTDPEAAQEGESPTEVEPEAVSEEAESAAEEKGELWLGDTGTLTLPLRRVLVTLLKGPYLYRDKRKDTWDLLMNHLPVIRSQLANLLLDLVVDDEVGVAFVKNPPAEDIDAPSLLNKYAFKFLDSVLLIEMRDRLMRAQQSGQRAMMAMDEINALLAVFEPSAGKDSKIFATRVSGVLRRMKERHLLIDLGRGSDTFEVSPVLKVVFDAAQVDLLRETYQAAAQKKKAAAAMVGSDAPTDDDEDDDDTVTKAEE